MYVETEKDRAKRLSASLKYVEERKRLMETVVGTTDGEKPSKASPVVQKIEGGAKKFFAGNKLYSTVTENPRKEGIPGRVSFQLVMDNPGIPFAEYLARGGRLQDAVWDYERGRMRVEADGEQNDEPGEEEEEENEEDTPENTPTEEGGTAPSESANLKF
jgi:hypothetical protein